MKTAEFIKKKKDETFTKKTKFSKNSIPMGKLLMKKLWKNDTKIVMFLLAAGEKKDFRISSSQVDKLTK